MYRKSQFFMFQIIILIFVASCGFYSFKGSMPVHIKSVVISPIINETFEYTSKFVITDLDHLVCETASAAAVDVVVSYLDQTR